jgi:chromosome segregation ATPase
MASRILTNLSDYVLESQPPEFVEANPVLVKRLRYADRSIRRMYEVTTRLRSNLKKLQKENAELKAKLEHIEELEIFKKKVDDRVRERVIELENNLKLLNTENLKLTTQLDAEKENVIQLREELSKIKQEKKNMNEEIERLQNILTEHTKSKHDLLAEVERLKVMLDEIQSKLKELQNENARLRAEAELHGESEELSQEGFTAFIADTLQDLEQKMQEEVSVDEDKKFVVKEMEIEAKVAVEKKGNKGVYVFPTAEKLKGIHPDQLQKLKFVIRSVPKIT